MMEPQDVGRQALPPNNTATVQPPELAYKPDILGRFAEDLARCGLVGEERAAKLLYLALTSRVLDKPVSAAVKGPSSAGKSHLVRRVLEYFPESAYYEMTAMSEKVLVYDDEPISHRFLVVCEAEGIRSDFLSYVLRTLLTEGCLNYKTVQKTESGFGVRKIHRDGPTGLVITTTKVKLHPENETRLFSIPVNDSPDQTAAVMLAMAQNHAMDSKIDRAWLDLQVWLDHAKPRVVIPYAPRLSELMPPNAVRLRRDFGALLSLIKAHALLHQLNRKRDDQGRIIATLEDYAVVRRLVSDLLSQGVGASVPTTVRDTVAAVSRIGARRYSDMASWDETGPNLTQVAHALGIDKSAASRRVRQAIEQGYLVNLERNKGRPMRLALGEPLPDKDSDILPSQDDPRLTGDTVERFSGDGEGCRRQHTIVREPECDSGEAA